jgi:DNA-binding transcriptional ArsR family regulator
LTKKSRQSNDELQEASLDRLIHALNHPIRRRILTALAHENGSAKTLSRDLREPMALVSYHLNKVLDQECEVVELVDLVPKRGARERVYALKEESIVGVLSWPGIPTAVSRGLRAMSLREFAILMSAAIETGSVDSPLGSTLEWSPAQVDGQSWLEIRDATKHFNETVKRAVDRSRTRKQIQKDADELHNVIVGIAAFQAAPAPKLEGTQAPTS